MIDPTSYDWAGNNTSNRDRPTKTDWRNIGLLAAGVAACFFITVWYFGSF